MNSHMLVLKNIKPNNEGYYDELREYAAPLSEEYVNRYIEAVKGVTEISDDTRSFLEETCSHLFDCLTSTLIPFTFILSRIITEKPWVFFKTIQGTEGDPLIPTYNELYQILQCFDQSVALKLLEDISDNSSIRNTIISAYKSSSEETFSQKIENTGEDYTDFMNRIYLLSSIFMLIDVIIKQLGPLKRGILSFDQLCQKEVEDVQNPNYSDITYMIQNLSLMMTGDTNGLNDWEKIIDSLHNIGSIIEDNIEKDNEAIVQAIGSYIDNGRIEEYENSACSLLGTWATVLVTIYTRIEKSLLSEESNIIDNLINNSRHIDYMSEVYQIVTGQEPEEADQTEAVGTELFLPTDFYNTKNRKQNETECVSSLKQTFIEAGVESLCDMINFIAEQGHIENTLEQKRNFAFRLTGFHSDYALSEKIYWKGDPNILSFIIQKIYYRGNWENAKRLFHTEKTLYNNLSLRKSFFEEQAFKELFEKHFTKL